MEFVKKFSGEIESSINCLKCKNSKLKKEDFIILSLPVADRKIPKNVNFVKNGKILTINLENENFEKLSKIFEISNP